ncbi:MAG: hypothetical protein EA350_14990 [Gemmatimonadales bacterium]|nr:MAG: hypothetical protein EA350_14990 [Gemmatimonadales bacterium]
MGPNPRTRSRRHLGGARPPSRGELHRVVHDRQRALRAERALQPPDRLPGADPGGCRLGGGALRPRPAPPRQPPGNRRASPRARDPRLLELSHHLGPPLLRRGPGCARVRVGRGLDPASARGSPGWPGASPERRRMELRSLHLDLRTPRAKRMPRVRRPHAGPSPRPGPARHGGACPEPQARGPEPAGPGRGPQGSGPCRGRRLPRLQPRCRRYPGRPARSRKCHLWRTPRPTSRRTLAPLRDRIQVLMMIAQRIAKPALVLLALLAVAACEGATDAQRFSLDAPRGRIDVTVFADLDRSRTFSGGDRALPGVDVSLVTRGTVDTIRSSRTSENGELVFLDIPAGSFDLVVDPAILGDTLVFAFQNPDPLVVSQNVNQVLYGVSYPIVSLSAARESSQDRRIFVEGIAASATGSLPGNALHIWAPGGWLRVEGTSGPGLSVGDSVRVRGRVHREGGSVVFRDGLHASLPGSAAVTPVTVTTQDARTAAGGLDGALVQIETATLGQVVVQGGVATAQLSDGSGTLMIQVPTAHLVDADLPLLRPGGTVTLTGVLIPQAGGSTWILRTRRGDDVAITSTGSMQGRVFVDVNRSGTFDAGDTPVQGVRLEIRAAQISGGVLAEVTTGSDGRFQVSGLTTGAYAVTLDPFTYPANLSVGGITPSPIVVETNQSTEVAVPLLQPATFGNPDAADPET